MRFAELAGIRHFRLVEAPAPVISKESDVLVRIKMVGVCGSDVHYYTDGRIGSQAISFPFPIGHEAAGIVAAIGSGVRRVKPGDRIAIDPALSCGSCDQCLAGRENTCRKLLFMGAPGQLPGALCEAIVLHENHCFPVPDTMSFEQATLAEPLAIGLYAVERSRLPSEARVGIIGAGPIGLSVLHVLRSRGTAAVYITDKIEERLAYARGLAPAWSGNPGCTDILCEIASREPLLLDAVYECSGTKEGIAEGLQLLKPGGTLLILGIPGVDEVSFPIHELRRWEITILNIRRQAHCTRKAIDLLAGGLVNMDGMATHHFPLAEVASAFELVSGYRDGVIKAMITL